MRTHYICNLGCYPLQRLHGRSVPSSGLARRRSQRPFAKTRFAWTCPVMLAHWPSNRVTSYTFSSCGFRILSCATRLQRHAILHTRCAPVVTGGRARKVRIPETVQMAIANGHQKVCGHWRAGIICSFNHTVHCRRGVQSPRRDNRSPRCGVPQRQTGGLCGYGWTSFRVTASFSEVVEPAGQDRVTIL